MEDRKQHYAPAHVHIHSVMSGNARILTFDPVSLIEADFSLSLCRVWPSSYKDSSWDGAVEASPLACGLSGRAGGCRPGWEGEGEDMVMEFSILCSLGERESFCQTGYFIQGIWGFLGLCQTSPGFSRLGFLNPLSESSQISSTKSQKCSNQPKKFKKSFLFGSILFTDVSFHHSRLSPTLSAPVLLVPDPPSGRGTRPRPSGTAGAPQGSCMFISLWETKSEKNRWNVFICMSEHIYLCVRWSYIIVTTHSVTFSDFYISVNHKMFTDNINMNQMINIIISMFCECLINYAVLLHVACLWAFTPHILKEMMTSAYAFMIYVLLLLQHAQ